MNKIASSLQQSVDAKRYYKESSVETLNAASISSNGTGSQFGKAFKAASSLYAPGWPCIRQPIN